MNEKIKKKVVIYGISRLTEMIYYSTTKYKQFEIAGFTVDKEYIKSYNLFGLPIVEFDSIKDNYPADKFDMLVVSGGGGIEKKFDSSDFCRVISVKNRQNMYLKAKNIGYKFVNFIDGNVDKFPNLRMGENNIVYNLTHLGSNGRMRNNNLFRHNCYIGHDFEIGDHNFVAAGCNIGGNCKIGNGCFIGIGATIVNDCKIADETLLGAGSVAIKYTEPFSKYVGNPAKKIGEHKKGGIKFYVK